MKRTIVTTSWDDGHVLDMKLSVLLSRYDLPATFYIAPANRELSPSHRLTQTQVRELAQNFEIGAHTMTHPRLSAVDAVTARSEIIDSKKTLEEWTGKAVTSFCYPGGDFLPEHKNMVKDAGFTRARTVKRFSLTTGTDPFEMPTTVHAYRHWSDIAPIAKISGAKAFFTNYLNWDNLAITLFNRANNDGGVFHLWGHSWEIEKRHDWNRLERVFAHISHHENIQYLRNSELT